MGFWLTNSLVMSPLLRLGNIETGHQTDLPDVAQFCHFELPKVQCFRSSLLKCPLGQESYLGRGGEQTLPKINFFLKSRILSFVLNIIVYFLYSARFPSFILAKIFDR